MDVMCSVVAVTGGIGSGKSVICRMLQVMGFEIYDCDSRAREIMDSDMVMKRRIVAEITPDALDSCGNLRRKVIADVVFGSDEKLCRLNAIVHGAVKEDLARWISSRRGNGIMFVETAILYESGLDEMVDYVMEVTAPENLRIKRAMKRDSAEYRQIKARIEAQDAGRMSYAARRHPRTEEIVNDGVHPVLPRLHQLLGYFGSGEVV